MTIHEEKLLDIRIELEAIGIDFPASPIDPDGAILLAAAVNWAAKSISESWYAVKAAAFVAASQVEGVVSGWNDGVFYLEGVTGLQVSAHDPFGEIEKELERLSIHAGYYPRGWDGKHRQEWAVAIAGRLPLIRTRNI
jgi:hypothetical protein